MTTGRPTSSSRLARLATINGQPGTYYFRTDDQTSQGTRHAGFRRQFLLCARVQTRRHADTGRPNADHAGFAGLAWDDLQLTDGEVRVTPTATNGGTTELNDSNPDSATGEFAFAVGGPARTPTYDAGW